MRYVVRRHKATQSFAVWDETRDRLAHGPDLTRAQADDMASVMNQFQAESEGASKVHDSASRGLDPVQEEIARRVSLYKTGGPDQVHDSGCACGAHAPRSKPVRVADAQRFVAKRMRAFARGAMKDARGKTVNDRHQAQAIALSEARAKGLKVPKRRKK